MKYDIYAGMGGSFGGPTFVDTLDFTTAEEADKYAYDEAWLEYESYAGLNGIISWDEIYNECEENGEFEGMSNWQAEEYVNNLYQEEVESWIEWYAEPHVDE